MKTLHVYLTRQVLATLLLTVAVFTGVLLTVNVIKEVFSMVFSNQASFTLVFKAIALLIPFVLSFSLPIGLLTAALLVFGRVSADQELTAVRAGGVSLLSWISPVLLLSVLCSVLCSGMNMYVAPISHRAYKDLLYEFSNLRPESLLTAGVYIQDFHGVIVYVGKIEGQNVSDVQIQHLNKNGVRDGMWSAPGGYLEQGANSHEITLNLTNCITSYMERDFWAHAPPAGLVPLTLTLPSASDRPLKANELTYSQLRDRLRADEDYVRKWLAATKEAQLARADDLKAAQEDMSPTRVQMNQQVSFSFACIAFTLVGIPLGIRSHRRETSVGIAVALVLVLLYYSFFIFAVAESRKANLHPEYIVWLPNVLFEVIGLTLLWRANRT